MRTRFIGCPEMGCYSPAEIVGEDLWPSTEGGIAMARIIGACGHHFLMPAIKLDLHALLGLEEVNLERHRAAPEEAAGRRFGSPATRPSEKRRPIDPRL